MATPTLPPAMTGPQHWLHASEIAAKAAHAANSVYGEPARIAALAALADVHARLASAALLADALYEELPAEWAEVLR